MTDNSDQRETKALVSEASQGNPLAIDELLGRYLPSVRAYLRLRAGQNLLDKESVSDLAQSVCRDVLEHMDRFQYDHEDGFRRWLFKTAERKVLDRHDYYTAKKRTPVDEHTRERDFQATLESYGSLHTPSRAAQAREELSRFEEAVSSLPAEQQEVIILAKIVGLSRAAIAEHTGKSEGAVRMILPRALARIADIMVRED